MTIFLDKDGKVMSEEARHQAVIDHINEMYGKESEWCFDDEFLVELAISCVDMQIEAEKKLDDESICTVTFDPADYKPTFKMINNESCSFTEAGLIAGFFVPENPQATIKRTNRCLLCIYATFKSDVLL